ncbi:MAG: DUF998 domain-containing protein [Candidatus Lokiarchaeota archaeon]|nr:DUF998 domain-containing protein [Candidatus Lokiarchaeota archaeon]
MSTIMENTDKQIEEKIQSNLKKDKNFGLSNIKTYVINGFVTLEGSIISLWHKTRAETITKTVAGVKGITNKLKIKPKQSELLKELMSESITNEKLRYVVDAHLSKIECYFGLVGVSFAIIFIIFAALVTPGYNPLVNTVSELGQGIAKTLFSIAFVSSGSLSIPFILYLEKTLLGINEFVRRIATAVAIISAVSVALVGILPDPENPDAFKVFHGIVAVNAFFGSVINICLYSYLMMKSNEYKKYHVVIGFATGFDLLLLLITLINPLVEWILTVNIMLWIIVTSIKLIRS